MKKKKFVGLTALLPLALFNVTALPVHAEVTDFQEADTSTEESSAECEVIYKSTYDFSEEFQSIQNLMLLLLVMKASMMENHMESLLTVRLREQPFCIVQMEKLIRQRNLNTRM